MAELGLFCLELATTPSENCLKFLAETDVCEKIKNRPFARCCEPHYESEAKCKALYMKISFVCI